MTLGSNCKSALYYLVSYEAPGNDPWGNVASDYPQTFYAVTTSSDGQSSLSVKLPGNCWQIDLVAGPQSPPAPANLTWYETPGGGSAGYLVPGFVWGTLGPGWCEVRTIWGCSRDDQVHHGAVHDDHDRSNRHDDDHDRPDASSWGRGRARRCPPDDHDHGATNDDDYRDRAPPATTTTVKTRAKSHAVKPVVTELTRNAALSGGKVGLALACSGAACRGSIKLWYDHVLVGEAPYSLLAGRQSAFTMALRPGIAKRLHTGKSHELLLTQTVTVTGGSTVRQTLRWSS